MIHSDSDSRCQIVSEKNENLWVFTTPDGRSVRKAIEYMYPYIRDKKSWTKPPDVMYFEAWPMRQESLLFGGLAYHRADYIDLWKNLPADSDVEEVIRNYFIRQPVLWLDRAPWTGTLPTGSIPENPQ